jgi:hypothetical protein
MGMPAPDSVKRLVDRFDPDRKVFLSGDYKEEQLRAEFLNGHCLTVCRVPRPRSYRRSELAAAAPVGQRGVWTFLDPFFTALGGDMDDKQGLSETFKQVIHEESIKVAGATTAPDHALGMRPPPDLLTG